MQRSCRICRYTLISCLALMIRRRNGLLQQLHFLQWLRAAKATLVQERQGWSEHGSGTKKSSVLNSFVGYSSLSGSYEIAMR